MRQRPSGRWVAEIKDTIHKIRVWLGTCDTAEEAARAYDEAACLLRGSNTHTNFWPCSQTPHLRPALPSEITNLLLLRLQARHIASASRAGTSLPISLPEQETEVKDYDFDRFFNVPKDCTFYENSDTLTNSTSGVTNSDNITESFESSSIGVEEGWVRALDMDDNWTKVDDGKSTQGGEKLEEVGEKEDFDMGHIDFQFVDAVGSACYYSPFEIAEEMVEPVEQENHGNEPSLLGET